MFQTIPKKKVENIKEELRLAYEYLDTILLNLPVGVAILEGPDFRYFRINKTLADLNGLPIEAHLGKKFAEVLPEAALQIIPHLRKVRRNGKETLGREFSIVLPKNPKESRYLMDFHFPIKVDGEIKAVGAVVLDITERKKMEEKLQLQKNLYSKLVETIPHVIWTGNSKGEVTFLNKAWKDWTGREIKDSLGNKWAESVHPDDVEKLLAKWKRAYKYGESYRGECRFKTKDGLYKYTSFVGVPVRDSSGKINNWIGIDVDITEHKRFEKQIKASLKEKERLLQEIHHRVKNNLQVISSLLNLQSKYVKDENLIKVFEECKNRIKVMAVIHERLYQSKNLTNIDSEEYIKNLAKDVFSSHVLNKKLITLKIKTNSFLMDINTAIQFGLILNELVSNSIQHAFPKGKKGEININLIKEDDTLLLTISDNGVGLSNRIDFQNATSLGLRLVNILTKQLGGRIEIDRTNGTKFSIQTQIKQGEDN